MIAIFKKEFKAYFHSIIGWLFLAFFLAFLGLYFYLYNLTMGYGFLGYALSGISMIFVLLVPMVTMRIMAEEKKQKTDQLLFTAPISVEKVILGKYLALIALFGMAMAVTCIYPIILAAFGTINVAMTYLSILNFFFVACAYMAIGMFISTVTESQAFAAVLTFIVVLFTCIADGIASLFSTSALTTFVVMTVLFAILGGIAYGMMKNMTISLLIFGICEAGLAGVYLVKPVVLEGLVEKLLYAVAMFGHFDNIVSGVFNLADFVYFISISFLFCFLTIQAVKKRRFS